MANSIMKKILIIDDDIDICSALTYVLEEIGFQVLEAKNGWLGLRAAIKELPALIISDLEMPVITGLMIFEELQNHALTENIPFIVMSGNLPKYLNKIKELGIKFTLEKPFSIDDLNKLVSNILYEQGAILVKRS